MAEIPIRCGAVCLVAVRRSGGVNEVLLLRRTRSLRGEWCQIAGGIEDGETAWQAAVRELQEETSLKPDTLYSGDICEQFYEAHRDAISLLPVFVAYIDGKNEPRLNAEHSEYCWVDFKTAYGMVPLAGQRYVLRHVEQEFMLATPSEYLRIQLQ